MKCPVSIVVLTRNKLEITRLCLPTILHSSCRPLELIVVDNASTDGTREWLENFAGTAERANVRTTLVFNSRPEGCSTARNQAIDRASGDVLIFVDNDVAVRTRRWIEILLDTLLSSPDICMVGPKLVYPFPPHPIQCAGVGISRTGRVQFIGRGEPRDDPRFCSRRETQCLISACLMARRQPVVQAGGFDEEFNPVQFEDFDLCYRLREKGLKTVYEPAAEMYHMESVTTGGTPEVHNPAVVVRHGLLFKRKWRHMFEREKGPPDSEARWKRLQFPPLSSVTELPLV